MRNSVLIITVVFVVALAMGVAAPPEVGTEQLKGLAEVIQPVADMGPLALLALIIVNNVLKTLVVVPLGIALAVPPLIFVVVNAYVIGAVASALVPEVGVDVVIASLLPHGILEIPALLVASGLGFWVGLGVIRRLAGRPGAAMVRLRSALRTYFVWVLPALLVAAVIEVFITPLIVDVVANAFDGAL